MSIKKITMLAEDHNTSLSDNAIYADSKKLFFRFEFDDDKPSHTVIYEMYYRASGSKDEYKISAVQGFAMLYKNEDLVFPSGFGGNIAGAELAFTFGGPTNPVEPPFVDEHGNISHTVKYINLVSSETTTPQVNAALWSVSELIQYGVQNPARGNICQNEDGFLHIHTRGMYGQKVRVEMYVKDNEDKQVLLHAIDDISIYGNTRYLPVPMNKVHSRAERIVREASNFSIFAKIVPYDTSITPLSTGVITMPANQNAGKDAAHNTVNGVSTVQVGDAQYGEKPDPQATLALEKVAFDTSFEVCNDAIESNSDEANIWVLKDKDNKYYHWLRNRAKADKDKPDPIPITLAGCDMFSFKASFKKQIADAKFKANPIIRVTHKNTKNPFLFIDQTVEPKDEMEVTFTATNQPYNNTIQYIQKLELFFEYSTDGGVKWTGAGSSINTLYLTWDNPLYDNFDKNGLSSRIKHTSNNDKKCILETLLWTGCKYAQGKGNLQNPKLMPDENKQRNEEAIADAIFEAFKGLILLRAREGRCRNSNPNAMYYPNDFSNTGLGYWRGKSVANGDINSSGERSVRYLLKYGEARCGEWTGFFLHLLLAQGINVSWENDTLAICTDFMYVEGGRKSYKYTFDRKYNNLKSYKFSVKQAHFIFLSDNHSYEDVEGMSAGQGNPNAQPWFFDHIWVYFRKKKFYDPSYGVSYNEAQSNIANYCKDNIPTILLEERNYRELSLLTPLSKDHPHFNEFKIERENIHLYLNSNKSISFK